MGTSLRRCTGPPRRLGSFSDCVPDLYVTPLVRDLPLVDPWDFLPVFTMNGVRDNDFIVIMKGCVTVSVSVRSVETLSRSLFLLVNHGRRLLPRQPFLHIYPPPGLILSPLPLSGTRVPSVRWGPPCRVPVSIRLQFRSLCLWRPGPVSVLILGTQVSPSWVGTEGGSWIRPPSRIHRFSESCRGRGPGDIVMYMRPMSLLRVEV